jgi:uncharacterized membrane protein YphA (DoxX/SURF4 family)
MKLKQISLGALVAGLLLPLLASAHEQYVLTKNQINGDIAYKSPNVFSALQNPGNLKVAITVGIFSLIGVILYFLFQHSRKGKALDVYLQKAEDFGHVVLRFALGASFIASAHFSAFLGPELPLSSLPLAGLLKYALYILGTLMLVGLWSEAVGVASLIILLLATWVYKDYMLSYVNYLGEFVALIIFGSRTLSLDKLFFKTKEWVKKWHNYEIAIIRITYGISVMYPAIVYKLQHPEVIIDIVNRYNLTQFHWLFPHDPLLVSLGTGLAQVAVGICLILGFETRLNSLITFALMAMSVMFFKEAVWPHYILLALALYLVINNGGKWSLDSYIENNKQKLKERLLRKVI